MCRRAFHLIPIMSLVLASLGAAQVPGPAGGSASQPAWSPDGTRLAYVSDELGTAVVVLQDLATGERRFLGPAEHPAWSPDGRQLAVVRQPEEITPATHPDVWVVDVATGSLRNVTAPLGDAYYGEAAWSPDGKWLAVSRLRGNTEDLLLLPLGGGTPRAVGAELHARMPAWSPDGARIAIQGVASRNFDLYLLNVASGTATRLTSDPRWDGDPAWSPDGSRLLFVRARVGGADTAHLWSVGADGRGERAFSEAAVGLERPAWAPDGRRVAYAHRFRNGADLFALDLEGREVARYTWLTWADTEPAWAPDGTRLAWIAVRDGEASLVVADTGGAPRTLVKGMGDLRSPGWSPDGRSLAFIGGAGAQLFVVAADGASPPVARTAPCRAEEIRWRAAWAPDGRRIAVDHQVQAMSVIEVVPAAGGEARIVAGRLGGKEATLYLEPAWAPDGRLAWTSRTGPDRAAVMVADAEGRAPRRVTPADAFAGHAAFSPDGRRLAWVRWGEDGGRIWVGNADGTSARAIAGGPWFDWAPAWSPDGTRLAIASTRDGGTAVFIVRLDGAGVRRVSPRPGAGAPRPAAMR